MANRVKDCGTEELKLTDPERFALVNDSSAHTMFFMTMKYAYRMLKRHDWNRTKAAYELDVSIKTVRNYIEIMKKIGWNVPDNTTSPNPSGLANGE
jgi:regulatory Fis family protein